MLQKSDELGWIRRSMRRGGPREKNQTNLYDLRLPQSICHFLLSINYRPADPISDGYRYPQSAPTEGGRPDKSDTPTRQNGHTDPSLEPSITGKLEQGRLEHSVSEIRHRPLTRSVRTDLEGSKKRIEEGVGDEFEVPASVERFFSECATGPRPFSAIRAFCQQWGGDITQAEITALVRAGKLKKFPDGYFMEIEF